MRKKVRRPMQTELPENLAGDTISPLEQILGEEKMARYDAALARSARPIAKAIVRAPRAAISG